VEFVDDGRFQAQEVIKSETGTGGFRPLVPSSKRKIMSDTATQKDELVIVREFNASREKVWRAWSEPELMKQWMAPQGFTCPSYKMDFREGGKYHGCMRSPEGKDFWNAGEYKEIVKPERIVSTDHFSDAEGNYAPSMFEGWPDELTLNVSFEEHDGKTKMTIHHLGIPEGDSKEMCRAGWGECLDKLQGVVEG
jgi:uncharacterized protein YndB with AHSA1/START domain